MSYWFPSNYADLPMIVDPVGDSRSSLLAQDLSAAAKAEAYYLGIVSSLNSAFQCDIASITGRSAGRFFVGVLLPYSGTSFYSLLSGKDDVVVLIRYSLDAAFLVSGRTQVNPEMLYFGNKLDLDDNGLIDYNIPSDAVQSYFQRNGQAAGTIPSRKARLITSAPWTLAPVRTHLPGTLRRPFDAENDRKYWVLHGEGVVAVAWPGQVAIGASMIFDHLGSDFSADATFQSFKQSHFEITCSVWGSRQNIFDPNAN